MPHRKGTPLLGTTEITQFISLNIHQLVIGGSIYEHICLMILVLNIYEVKLGG